MEENQKASQGYGLFSTYKRPELLKEKYGVDYCFKLMIKLKPNVISGFGTNQLKILKR